MATTKIVSAGLRPIGTIETPREDDMPCKEYNGVRSLSISRHYQVVGRRPEEDIYENINRNDKAESTSVGDAQHNTKNFDEVNCTKENTTRKIKII